jgi:predicted acyltransferase
MRLDVVRGLAVGEMILVDNPGSDDRAYGEIRHVEGAVEHRSTSSFRPFYFRLASR